MVLDVEGKWSGILQGTNTGRIFVDIKQDSSNLQASVHINDLDIARIRHRAGLPKSKTRAVKPEKVDSTSIEKRKVHNDSE